MTDRRSGAQRGWPKGATAQMGLPSKWSGAVWRGRQPEPTPSFTESRFQFPPFSSRGYPPVAIHCAPINEPTKPERFTSRHDGLPRQTIVLLAMTECVVISRAEPVAIHCEPINEPTNPKRFTSRHDGLPRQTIVLLAMTECVVIARAKPVAIHCEPISEPTKPDTRTSRHDGLPRQTNVLLAMTNCVVIARAQPVAIHCAPRSEPTNPERFTSRHDGLPRPFVPRNDNIVKQNTTNISSPLRVLARAQPVAIDCTPGSEPTNPERNSC
jgi:hypothetical protein